MSEDRVAVSWILLSLVLWLLRKPTLRARGWNPDQPWEEYLHRYEGVLLFSFLAGVGLLLAESISGQVHPERITLKPVSWIVFAVGTTAATWLVQAMRLRRPLKGWVARAAVPVWCVSLALSVTLTEPGDGTPPELVGLASLAVLLVVGLAYVAMAFLRSRSRT